MDALSPPPPGEIAAASSALAPKPSAAPALSDATGAGAAASPATTTAGAAPAVVPAEGAAAGETPDLAAARTILATAERKEASARAKLAEAKTETERGIARAELKGLLLKSPTKFLADNAGVSVQEFLAAYQAEQTGEAPKLTVEEELAALRKDIDDERKAAAEHAEAETIESVKAGIKGLLMSPEHLEEFDHINTRGAHDFVSTEALAYAKKYPEMTPEQGRAAVLFIARKVEAQLDDDIVSIAKGKKFQQRFTARAPAVVLAVPGAAALPGAAPAPAADMTTLANGLTRAAPPSVDPYPTGDPVKRWAAIQAAHGIKN